MNVANLILAIQQQVHVSIQMAVTIVNANLVLNMHTMVYFVTTEMNVLKRSHFVNRRVSTHVARTLVAAIVDLR